MCVSVQLIDFFKIQTYFLEREIEREFSRFTF
jgi:hypothetical protein